MKFTIFTDIRRLLFLLLLLGLTGCGRAETETFEETGGSVEQQIRQVEFSSEEMPSSVLSSSFALASVASSCLQRERPRVKGIFVSGPMAGTDNMQNLIGLVERTELNTIVMDVKNDEGKIVYDMQVPDAEPYRLVLAALQASQEVLAGTENVKAAVRPWLQDFTATWVKGHISYGAEEIRAQINGVYDAGYEEWILWNAANRYTEEGLLGSEEAQEAGNDSEAHSQETQEAKDGSEETESAEDGIR